MKVRLMGLKEDVFAVLDTIKSLFDIVSVSETYSCRNSREIRVYVEIKI